MRLFFVLQDFGTGGLRRDGRQQPEASLLLRGRLRPSITPSITTATITTATLTSSLAASITTATITTATLTSSLAASAIPTSERLVSCRGRRFLHHPLRGQRHAL